MSVSYPKTLSRVELHHFSDASLNGYGQCSYVRLIDDESKVHCSLAMAKARVAPLKPTTVPRLELQAAVSSIQVSKVLVRELDYKHAEHFFWTDSKVVLGYISNEARRFHMFVANRVQRIRDASSPEQWQYIETSVNPADHASRGLQASELISSNWFKGPAFLWERDLPAREDVITNYEPSPSDPEVKKVQILATRSSKTEDFLILDRLERFSSWSRAVRALTRLRCCVLRKKGLIKEEAAITERTETERIVIKALQRRSFAEDMDALARGETIKNTGFARLDPFLDDQGMLRVGGRLNQASSPYDIKHPLILPKKGHVVNLIVQHFHEKVAHQGRGITTNEIRANGLWIIGFSTVVSSNVHKCVECRRLRGKTQEQKMADLPEERVDSSPPFTFVGLDCFGPFYIKEGRKMLKRYGLLFTCLALRAVHIEVIDDMTTDAFLNGLRCLIAIRGDVRKIRCDQGSNFIGANNELREAMKEIDTTHVNASLSERNCEFQMNPPSASHMGGVWERQIRTIRSVLSGLLEKNSQQLDTSSLRTLMYETMAIINSRPLTAENLYDPGAPLPLTPNHLLTMKSKVIMPPPGVFVKEDLYLRKRWRSVQHLANLFWTRWKREYLNNLQARQKWLSQKANVHLGDIVILKDEDKARSDWRLARIEKTVPDKDGLVRKVELLIGEPQLDKKGRRTSKQLKLERPVHKLILLVESPSRDKSAPLAEKSSE